MSQQNECPVCKSNLINFCERPNDFDGNQYFCPRCGDFRFARTLVSILPNKLSNAPSAWAKISHALQSMQANNQVAEMDSKTVDKVLERSLPSPSEQADLLVRWIAKNVNGPGETVEVRDATHGGIIGSKSDAGFKFVLQHLYDVELLSGNLAEDKSDFSQVTLSFKGWEHYESLLQGDKTYRKAFMAMKFGDSTLDKIVNEVFRPAAQQTGFELRRLDNSQPAGLIDNHLRVEIQTSDFLIADLTHDNLGAYWEAGYAEGLGKPVVYTCEKMKFEQKQTHFDTNHHLTIKWDQDNPNCAAEELKATIRASLPELAKQQDG